MTKLRNLLTPALAHPATLADLSLSEWDLFIRQARTAGVLGTIHIKLDELGLLGHVPTQPLAHLIAAQNLARHHERILRWEVYSIGKALRNVDTEIILLKGAAYALSDMPHSRGRLQSDVDILVPRSRLRDVESALLEQGWRGVKLEKYDQRYYRQWSHELPPLVHSERHTVVDVHHNILPGTGRLHPDAEKLLKNSQPIAGTEYRRLCPQDMVLHASAHMFQDGSLTRGLRELSDVNGLVRTFSGESGFWNELLRRAPEMDLHRPLFYALRYSNRYLETPVPRDVLSKSQEWAPANPALVLMDTLVSRALEPSFATAWGSGTARWLLYARSHWLRMPPWLLAQHLTHQWMVRTRGSFRA